MENLDTLKSRFPHPGEVIWISIRPGKKSPLKILDSVLAIEGVGLEGDHYSARPGSQRQVTLIQEEHLAVIASMLQQPSLDPALLRRNIVVRGVNLLALKEKQFQIGDALLEMSGLCHPCSRMEQNLGIGGYNAMRGHGGITARVVGGGLIKTGDQILATSSR